ncbi:WD repeat-containing protein 26 isoform X2 [Amborella trichopoda]|uniref:CTLH domain-containing protein n=1 Tax=Amborella trichopoda TaxID=13333 RepID=U5D678_AMBTC|nr:WD repeat-containing protein 26 isoform X2 [Amborella trichopoda]ERN15863.1 hypothetical protein AMTR_s00039p00186000 [Amborella trichopoda]|eukprot:XP_006854396.1 WD repeat-containing protein 26 isoform X2 [Amborella trichopoda]
MGNTRDGEVQVLSPQKRPKKFTISNSMDDFPLQTLGSTGLIRTYEFIRVLIQSLYSLGYSKAASLLEEESGIALHSPDFTLFKTLILEAKWEESIEALHKINNIGLETRKAALFLILEQEFFEFLNKGDISLALKVLQCRIAPLRINGERVRELACCVVWPKFCEDFGAVDKGSSEARVDLLMELQRVLPPEVILPERRLEHLIEMALEVQRESCVYHNSVVDVLSLYSDHRCGRDQIPTETLQVLDDHEDEVWYLQFSNKGKYLASSSRDCTAIIWMVSNDGAVSLKHRLTGHQNPVSYVSWSPDDTMLLTCGMGEALRLWSVGTGMCTLTFGKGSSGVTSCAWFPDSRRFSGGCDNCIYTWDIEGRELDAWRGPRMPKVSDLAVTPDGAHLVGICAEKDIRIYALGSKSERVIEEEQPITSLSVSRDGEFILVNLNNQEIHMWDLAGRLGDPSRFRGHRQSRYVIRSCFGGLDHAFIASGSEDSQIYIWHRRNCELIEVLGGHSSTVNCVSWNPMNPQMFASASDDRTIRIWGVSRGKK